MNKKTVFEIVDNKTGKVIETFSFSVSVKKSDTAYKLSDDKTGEVIDSFSFSIRVRLRPVDIEKYKKTHVLLNRLEG